MQRMPVRQYILDSARGERFVTTGPTKSREAHLTLAPTMLDAFNTQWRRSAGCGQLSALFSPLCRKTTHGELFSAVLSRRNVSGRRDVDAVAPARVGSRGERADQLGANRLRRSRNGTLASIPEY